MSSGTDIIHAAGQMIGIHSVASPMKSESVSRARDVLNAMLQEWLDLGINLPVVPLKDPGDELSEPAGARQAIEESLAIRLAPEFATAKTPVTSELRLNAFLSYDRVKRLYQDPTPPDRGVSSTMPRGQGNMRGTRRRVFVGANQTVDG